MTVLHNSFFLFLLLFLHHTIRGGNQNGNLATGNTVNVGDNSYEMGDALPFVSLGMGFRATHVSQGYSKHFCVTMALGTSPKGFLKCYGSNIFGEGYPTHARSIVFTLESADSGAGR